MAEKGDFKNESSVLVVQNRQSQLFPNTYQSIRERNYVKRLNKFWNEHNTKMILETKLRNLEDIKNQMLHNKMIYECHTEEKRRVQNYKDSKLLNNLRKHYNFRENVIPPHSFINRFKQYKKSQQDFEIQQVENKIAIVKKLMFEYKREQEISFQQLNINEKLLLMGKDENRTKNKKIESIEISAPKLSAESFEDTSIELLDVTETKSTETISSVEIKTNSKIQSTEEETENIIQSKLKSTKPLNDIDNLDQNIPPVPILNPREKIPIPNEIVQIDELLNSWMNCDFLDQKRELYAKQFLDSIEEDDNFFVHPNLIVFNDFTNGKLYKKAAVITNKDRKLIKCKFIKIQHNYDPDPMILQVYPNSTQVLWCGMSIPIKIIFNPIDVHNAIEGEIIFHTLRVDYAKQKQIKLKIVCLPLIPEVCIDPEVIVFKALPFWKSYNKIRTKKINIKNSGTEKYFISIRHIIRDIEKKNTEEIKSQESLLLKENSYEMDDKELTLQIAQDILNTCIYQAFAVFRIDPYFFEIPPMSSVTVQVLLCHTYTEGQVIENFALSMYEDEECTKLVTSKDFLAKCDCTGIFYSLNQYVFDFQICVVDSGVYQNSFTVFNNYKNLLLFKNKCPDCVKDYISIYPTETYISSLKSQVFTIRFIPRYEMLQQFNKYYDPTTGILDFPVKVYAIGPEHGDTPPLNLHIYAILTNPYDIIISWPQFDTSQYLEEDGEFSLPDFMLDKSVHIKIDSNNQIENYSNNSHSVSDSIPLIMNTTPLGLQKSTLNCDFQLVTTRESVYVKFNLTNKTMVVQEFGFLNLPKCVSILPAMGFGIIYPGETLNLVLIYSPEITDIKGNTKNICGTMGSHSFGINCSTIILSSQGKPYDVKNLFRPQTELNISFNSIIQDPLCLVEYQYLEYPSTPCGSYTLMTMELRASPIYPCYCGIVNKIEPQNFTCEFEFKNTNSQLFIEPRHGTIKTNGKVKVFLLSQPILDYKIVYEKAVIIKEAKLKEIKLNEIIAKAEKAKKPLKEIPEIIINPNDIILDSTDLYMAEKEIWRSLDPYIIQTHVTCLLNYTNIDRKEVLFFDVRCPVVNPDFLLDIEKELIDFGPTVIGGYKKHLIRLQNITSDIINPTISLVNPLGPLKCFYPLNINLDPEHFLLIPIIFEPIDEKPISEYIQFKSNNTIVHINVRGFGIELKMEYTPDFPIRRIETGYNTAVDVNLDFKNLSDSEIRYTIKLVNELEGHVVQEIPYPSNVVPPKPDKPPGKNSLYFSLQEEYSLRKTFKEKHGPSFFYIKQGVVNDNEIVVPPLMKASLKITFEEPKNLLASSTTKGKIVNPHLGKHFIVRYKLYLNGKTYIKDLIIIGSFI